MQFVANGPDIPDSLLMAHEEGRVVFFCGAGISYPAGLPDFIGLVDAIYSHVGRQRDAIEQEAYKRGQLDATLDLLERRLPGQRQAVRNALIEALQPDLDRGGATDTHAALLQLARNREGALHLVTTNFDRIFVRLLERTNPPSPSYSAPLLPIPKNSRWDGLVYLHGLLPEHPDANALDRLVLTSGDFGLAYLTERWAARFVSELFRNYIVCFVGYSINDPVLRYMMDALAADRMLGELTPQAYAMGDTASGEEDTKTVEWEAKGVVPILYEVPTGTRDHSVLHRTLKTWAETYRDGILGRERIVVEYAMTQPSASTRQDDFVSRMLWALSHHSGLPAKRFADFDPAPPLAWLEALTENRYHHCDLARFGVAPNAAQDRELRFSLLQRLTPYYRAPWMLLAGGNAVFSEWDVVMLHLARWLIRHLDDPALILWLAQRGGTLHSRLALLIEERLDNIADLERVGNSSELERLRAQSPNAIPRPLLRVLWRLLLTGQVTASSRSLTIYHWRKRFTRDGLTATLRIQLREILAPKIVLKKPYRWRVSDPAADTHERLKDLVEWELVLASSNVRSSVHELAHADRWRIALPTLVDDFQQLLRDALDLMRELGEGDDRSDRSHWCLPSISSHWQNEGARDWVALIEFLREAWLAIHEVDSARASRIARAWFAMPYATFKRLALFAASRDGCIIPDQWVDWVIADDAWWLWGFDTMRETLRLIVLQGVHLTSEASRRLEAAILAGPPRAIWQVNIDPEKWLRFVNHVVWLRLAKLKSSGTNLGSDAAERLEMLSVANPKWQLANHERDEFSSWTSGTGDPDFEESRVTDIAPHKRNALVAWLKLAPRSQDIFHEDNWRETCRSHFYLCAIALCDLAADAVWPTARWSEALQAWSEERQALRSWQYIAPLLQTMPDEVFTNIAYSITWWLEAVSKALDPNEDIFLDLCRRSLKRPDRDGIDGNDAVEQALNHPVGHVTQALLNIWFKRDPKDGDGLPVKLETFFSQLCDIDVAQFRHARVLLASRLVALFRVDRPWTEDHLLPLFNWSRDVAEAKAVWEGFMWSPRLYRPLLIALKKNFLDTANRYAEFGQHAQQLAAFLTHVALDPPDTYTVLDFQTAFAALPQEGLRESARTLVQALEGADEQGEDYWTNRIQPFWKGIWPKSSELVSQDIAEVLARLSIAARGKFPEALSAIRYWLIPPEAPDFVVQLLHESGLSSRFPKDALCLLNAIISDQPWAPVQLSLCLMAMSQAEPALLQDPLYLRLIEYARRHSCS